MKGILEKVRNINYIKQDKFYLQYVSHGIDGAYNASGAFLKPMCVVHISSGVLRYTAEVNRCWTW